MVFSSGIFVSFNILRNNTVDSGVALLMFVSISISYYIGGRRLATALGVVSMKGSKVSERIAGILDRSRKISGITLVVVLFMLICTCSKGYVYPSGHLSSRLSSWRRSMMCYFPVLL